VEIRWHIGDHVAARSITFSDGIVTSVSGQAAFDAALSGLTFADDSEKALLPYGVVVQNEGYFTVIAYCLQWTLRRQRRSAHHPGEILCTTTCTR
jgi:hypothetical protein